MFKHMAVFTSAYVKELNQRIAYAPTFDTVYLVKH